VLSLLLHVVLLTVLGLVLARVSKGTGAEADRPVGIAMVHRLPDRDRYRDAAESQPQPKQPPEDDPEPTEASSRSSSAAPPADLAPPLDLPGMLREMKSAPAPSAASGLAGDAALGADPRRRPHDDEPVWRLRQRIPVRLRVRPQR
jgi:hypothetical protein